MCNCGCNTCETKGPLLTEGKVKSLLSEGLQYHIDKKIPLFETVYRIGSKKHLSLIKEARKMYSRNIIDLCEEDEALIKTHLGEFALYEGVSIPLDLPMLNEIDEDDEYEIASRNLFDMTWDEVRRQNNQDMVQDVHDEVSKDDEEDWDDDDNIYTLRESNIPSQEEVNKFFSDTQNEMHYLNSKPVAGQKKTFNDSEVEPWDEYDLSNWKSLNRKAKLNEYSDENFDSLEDAIANSEFSMDYDQLGSGEKEWVRDEIDNMSMNEDRKYNQEELLRLDLIARRKFDCDYEKCTDEQKDEILKDKVKVGVKEAIEEKLKGIDGKACWKGYKLAGTKKKGGKTVDNCVPMEEAKQDIYDKFLDNPSSPKGRAKSLILKFTKEYGDDASSMAVDRFASKNNLKPEEKYILKYITKNDIKISSQSGGPDFSAVSEAEFKGKEVSLNKPKRGGPKAYYVYVKDGDKVKKVTFGSGGLRAKIKNKEARNAFAARHNCKDKKDRTKAGYWSCNLPRYAPALGLGAKMNTFW